MKKHLFYSISLLLSINYCVSQTLNWTSVGPNDFNQATCGTTERSNSDMVLSPSGTLYIAFNDWVNNQRLSVRKYNGTTWEYVGTPGLSTGYFYAPRLAFDNTGVPYVVFTDANNSSKLTVLKFNGTSWVTVGVAGFTNSNCTQPAITIDANGNVYVGYRDTNLGKMSCQKFNGTTWGYLGTAGFSANGANNTDIELDVNGNVFFKYGNIIAKYNGTSWSNLPTVNTSCYFMSMAIDNLGQPYVAFDSTTVGSTSLVRCLYFNGSTWVNSGTGTLVSKPLNTNAYSFTKVHFGKDNKPYVGFGENIGSGLYKPHLYVNNGSGWSAIQTSTVYPFNNIDNYPFLSVDNLGQIYFGTSQTDYNYGVCIYKYVSNAWSQLGNKDVTKGQLGNAMSFAFASNGDAYIAEVTGSSSSSPGAALAVKKYHAGVWDTVGVKGFNNDGSPFSNKAYRPKIKISSTGEPYVSYTQGYTSYTAKVKKFNGTSWVNLSPTAANVATNVTIPTDIDFLANDTVIVLTVDSYYSPSLSKFDGTNWVSMGGAINSPSNTSTDYHDLAVNASGIPYVAYVQTTGTASLQGLYVKKYESGSWQTVGTTTVATGIPSAVTLKFDATSMPFVAYAADNGTGGRKANVKKFNGTNWVNVGTANFTSSTADLLKMELDNSGNPTVIYQVNTSPTTDYLNYTKLTSMQFNGTSWVNVGGASHSAANVTETALEKNPVTGTITEAYMSLNSIRVAPNSDLNGLIWVKELTPNSSVGIENLNSIGANTDAIKVYPNPNSGSFYIYNERTESNELLEMYNLLGEKIYSQTINTQTTLLNLDLKAGVYFINITQENGLKATEKIIIQ